MKFKIQLISQTETGEAIQELACLERESEELEGIGINLGRYCPACKNRSSGS